MTATQTPCTTPEADRFQCAIKTPDPPAAHPARKRYWEDTVFEAVGELRARLASGREEVVTSALDAILAVEKTRMRHGRPLSGTQTPNVYEDDGSLPELGPLEVDTPLPPKPKRREGEAPAEPPTTVTDQPTADEFPTTVSPTRERGPLAVADPPAAVEPPPRRAPRSHAGMAAFLPPSRWDAEANRLEALLGLALTRDGPSTRELVRRVFLPWLTDGDRPPQPALWSYRVGAADPCHPSAGPPKTLADGRQCR